ncbi:hypothetical protein WR25_00348 [Diploscapter pachys]|uniref:Uncharacterized protein n=1 Tax=Diploscapter pachys TaxID=2018661 RepID=A0A2A2JZ14_9BILA|nr:hypothetical protein WR25_00348 [Diploscapter pachys]
MRRVQPQAARLLAAGQGDRCFSNSPGQIDHVHLAPVLVVDEQDPPDDGRIFQACRHLDGPHDLMGSDGDVGHDAALGIHGQQMAIGRIDDRGIGLPPNADAGHLPPGGGIEEADAVVIAARHGDFAIRERHHGMGTRHRPERL